MSKGRILVVERDDQVRQVIEDTLTASGYSFLAFLHATDALDSMLMSLPIAMILSNRQFYAYERGQLDEENEAIVELCDNFLIPIMFLSGGEDEQYHYRVSEYVVMLHDYVHKSTDFVLLKLLVSSFLKGLQPIPDDSIQGELKSLLFHKLDNWFYIVIRVNYYRAFFKVYRWAAYDAMKGLFGQVLSASINDFAGKQDKFGIVEGTYGPYCTLLSFLENPIDLLDEAQKRFQIAALSLYSDEEIRQGYVLVEGRQRPLMEIVYSVVSPKTHALVGIEQTISLAKELCDGMLSPD